MTSAPLRLRLLNDYEIVVAGLRTMLEPFADRVRVVETQVREEGDRRVDLTLYDTFGSARPDLEHIEELLEDPAAGTVVVYTWNLRSESVHGALERGCGGYLHKSLDAAELVRSLEQIGAGGVIAPDAGLVDDAETAAAEPETAPEWAWPGQREGLTPREAEVVALITRGFTNSEIAARSYISINSLKSYIRSAYRKMGVERRSQAVRWGIEHGMLPREHA
ncbi:response regulator transcription factor [Gulosibacter sp. 10]|uniref:response regulator transcription factor n=1 Tax=Gulosibacter sp. 10 TaxID=1255570 RepID=UPI00097EC0D2|nr:response regulator transcription factor [Gulosibacter sp. 10]SJM48908.1 regulatory protein, LuxR [Gulosibacter sp. 10]